MNATDLNVSALMDLVIYYRESLTRAYEGDSTIRPCTFVVSFPNAIPRGISLGAHIKRCQKAGLFVVNGKTITLTAAGMERITRALQKTVAQIEKGLIGKAEYAPFYTWANLKKHTDTLASLKG